MKYFLIPILMLVSKIAMSQIMLPAYQGVVAKIPTVVTPAFTCITSTITDVDNNVYNTVLIDTQCWTKQNLKVTKYNDLTAIPFNNMYTSGTVSTVWQGLRTGAYAIYANEASSGSNATNYGFLYNWYAAKGIYKTGEIASTDTLNICPIGWHVPTDTEWTTLTTYLGGENVAGGKMKSVGTSYWLSPNTGATNESGFSALPGGWRNYVGSFYNILNDAFFWSATEYNGTNAWGRDLYDNNDNVYRDNSGNKSVGASVRCLRN
jgi:uncharacterized protein (TIGR02145 family)